MVASLVIVSILLYLLVGGILTILVMRTDPPDHTDDLVSVGLMFCVGCVAWPLLLVIFGGGWLVGTIVKKLIFRKDPS